MLGEDDLAVDNNVELTGLARRDLGLSTQARAD
jgi:hypothetical protein